MFVDENVRVVKVNILKDNIICLFVFSVGWLESLAILFLVHREMMRGFVFQQSILYKYSFGCKSIVEYS